LSKAIKLLVKRFSLVERAEVACCGMTVAQALTLEALSAGPLRLGELGRRLGIAPSTLSRNLDRLIDRGLIVRGPAPDDRRALRAELTPEGRNAADMVKQSEIDFARDILDRLPKGTVATTFETLDNILEAVRSATERCCPGAFDHLYTGAADDRRERM